MKILLFIICLTLHSNIHAQDKWYKVTKNDMVVMGFVLAAGYTTGLREEVIQHPRAFMLRHPSYNPNFWDNNVQGKKRFLNMEWNADHVLKGATAMLFTTAITFKLSEKKKWYYYLVDGLKYYMAYKAGFIISYHIQEKNKL